MAIPNTIEVLAAISSYIENNNRPCPAHFLVNKFGDDVAEVVGSLKKEGKIIGKRGRSGGIVFPDTVFKAKDVVAAVIASPVIQSIIQQNEQVTESDSIEAGF